MYPSWHLRSLNFVVVLLVSCKITVQLGSYEFCLIIIRKHFKFLYLYLLYSLNSYKTGLDSFIQFFLLLWSVYKNYRSLMVTNALQNEQLLNVRSIIWLIESWNKKQSRYTFSSNHKFYKCLINKVLLKSINLRIWSQKTKSSQT